jgi:hypothetical protein
MDKDKSKPDEPEESAEVESFDIPCSGEINIGGSEKPPAAPPNKKIHRRRRLPSVKEAAHISDRGRD